MLGVIGFFGLVVAIVAYVVTSLRAYGAVSPNVLRLFGSAYAMLALCGVVWLSTLFVPVSSIQTMIFVTDLILITATILMAGVIVPLYDPFKITLATATGAGLAALRAFAFPPQGFVDDGLLHFNLSQAEVMVIGLLFLLVWLPATVKVVYEAFSDTEVSQFRSGVSFVFMATVLMTSFFLSAKRPEMIILTFLSIVILFVGLTIINLLLMNVQKGLMKGVKRGK